MYMYKEISRLDFIFMSPLSEIVISQQYFPIEEIISIKK